MPKMKLEFDLDAEFYAAETALRGQALAAALADIREWLRGEAKHGADPVRVEHLEDAYRALTERLSDDGLERLL
jgi:hypothetical protein